MLALHLPRGSFFLVIPVALCPSAGWEVAVPGWGCSVEETPPGEINSCKVGSICQVLHWSSEARTGGCQLGVRAGQHPCPKMLGHFQLVLSGGGAQSDAGELGLSPFGPHLLSFASPVRWQHLSLLSLPAAVGGKPALPPAWGCGCPALPPSLDMAARPCGVRLVPSAWVPLLSFASIPPRLSWSLARC